ncbi:hypothetical protein IPF86_00655 [Candidatus Nomurabacteria bacterium]|jgi:hypothetical protein|nr:MAG: hypothetical protein IPF86_00655 [Candidatus Nomurabacteria bacterium]
MENRKNPLDSLNSKINKHGRPYEIVDVEYFNAIQVGEIVVYKITNSDGTSAGNLEKGIVASKYPSQLQVDVFPLLGVDNPASQTVPVSITDIRDHFPQDKKEN